jgi:alpha-tubulin suppressor-like RCC1 family protein
VVRTAWLPDATRGGVVLADALTARAATAVSVGLPSSVTTVTQADGSAVALASDAIVVVNGATWRTTALRPALPRGAFVVAGGPAAWLLSPHVDTVRRIDIAAVPATLSDDPVVVGAGLAPRNVRVDERGTLWVLGSGELRSVPVGRPPVAIPLDPAPIERALTLVDGEPVVIEAHRVRHVDPGTVAFDREWAVDLPAGAITAAERSEHVAVARVGRRVTMAGPDAPPGVVDLVPGIDGPPVERGGLAYVADRRTGEVIVVDPRRPADRRLVRRIALGVDGPIDLFAHHGRVWYVGRNGGTTRAGVLTDAFVARPIGGYEPAAGPGGRSRGSSDADLPGEPAPPSPRAPSFDTRDRPCVRNWSAGRCLPDSGPRPGAPPGLGPSRPGCPRAWPPAACDGARPEAEAGPPAPGGPAGAPTSTIDFTWRPRPPTVGSVVTFTETSTGPAGVRRWSFEGGSPATATGTSAEVVWRTPGSHRVVLRVDGSDHPPALHDVVVLNRALPEVTGLALGAATDVLHFADLTVRSTHRVPALAAEDTVVAVRHNGVDLAAGAAVEPGWALDLDIADGSRPVEAVAPSTQHICTLVVDGTVACWGDNTDGRLGDGTTTDSLRAVLVPGLPTASWVTTGEAHSCALLLDGTVRCWGDNQYGQLGDGTTTDSPRPVVVRGLRGVVQLDSNGYHNCARLLDATLWCWGSNDSGQLGRGTDERSPDPVPVEGLDQAVRTISVGAVNTCAILVDTTVRCWGSNQFGQLGDGTPAEGVTGGRHPGPVAVPGIVGARDVASGTYATCVLLESGAVRCWGGAGSVGDGRSGDGADALLPVVVHGVDDARQISGGVMPTCVVVTGMLVRCWGDAFLRLDTGATVEEMMLPATVPGLTSVVSIHLGGWQLCAIVDDGSLYCWGFVSPGPVGAAIRYAPTRIRVE